MMVIMVYIICIKKGQFIIRNYCRIILICSIQHVPRRGNSQEGTNIPEIACIITHTWRGEILISFSDEVNRHDSIKWKDGVQLEINSLTMLGTWKFVKVPADQKDVRATWVYDAKHNGKWEIVRYKSRFAARVLFYRFLSFVLKTFNSQYLNTQQFFFCSLLQAYSDRFVLQLMSKTRLWMLIWGKNLRSTNKRVCLWWEKRIYLLCKVVYGLQQSSRE